MYNSGVPVPQTQRGGAVVEKQTQKTSDEAALSSKIEGFCDTLGQAMEALEEYEKTGEKKYLEMASELRGKADEIFPSHGPRPESDNFRPY